MTSSIAALKLHPQRPTELSGRIIEPAGSQAFLVARGQHRQVCKLAFGCFITPQAEDRVLLADVDGATFILAVLERSTASRPLLHLPDGLEIRNDGELSIAGQAVELAPQSLRFHAKTLDCQVEQLTYNCDEARGFVGLGKLVGRALEVISEKWVQISKQSFRISEQLECVRAAELDLEANGCLRLHAKHTLISADQLNKLDGRQIHVG
jgi:hypothetical protein